MNNAMPKFAHYCNKCQFLGQTIGNKRIVDLYACETSPLDGPSLVARYSDKDSDYASCNIQYARPEGHAELWAAKELWQRKQKESL
jgi:hypothetical protein